MVTRAGLFHLLTGTLLLVGAGLMVAQVAGQGSQNALHRPQGPCDVYTAAGDPCVAAHSTTRALYAGYNGPLYQVLRQSDGKTLDIGVVQPTASPVRDAGGYADAAAQDKFCANTYCWITTIYDQSGKHNDLTQAPRGGFSGPALGGFNNIPLADMAPIAIMGHKVYGVFIEPGMGLRIDDAKGTAVDDQPEGQYWVVNGRHFNAGCCFDYGNAEIDSRDDDNGTMETTYFGDAPHWYHGNPSGPWIMTDQENNLVGCVNPDGSKDCKNLPNITWRFVTAMAKGEPHHWTSLGGDSQQGQLSVMFDGPRVNATYDPMRKQGAILLGNGGDNSNGSQGTFYEGAMTAAGTFPTDATDQQIQENIVAARYGLPLVSIAPASAVSAPPGLQVFAPESSQESTVTFTNSTTETVADLKLSLSVPDARWTATVSGGNQTSKTFAEPLAPGASVSATFKVTAGPNAFNGDLLANATWTNQATRTQASGSASEKIRTVRAVKINEFRISSGATNATDTFLELYNSSNEPVDISRWTITVHPAQQAVSSSVVIPTGTALRPHSFYLLGLSNSGLIVPAKAGEATLSVRSVSGIKIGDTVTIDTGTSEERRKVIAVGAAAPNHTTVWQPLPEGPIITIPPGATNLPVMSVAGFKVGEKIALGYGASYPAVGRDTERYEIVTVTEVGKPGTQAYLAADAAAGATNIKVTSVSDIPVGDKIRLDIDSVGHGIETLTVTHIGTQAAHTALAANSSIGSTNIKVRNVNGFAIGDKASIGTPANQETVSITAIGTPGATGTGIDFTPALARAHIRDENLVAPGTGLDLAAPLQFNHAANLPFSNRGTGISFAPATAFAHASNEPVQPLGTGLTLDKPLQKDHPIHAVLRDSTVTNAGYQGAHAPDLWFGGPEFTTNYPLFGRTITIREGSIVLRDAAGLVMDSLNYGGLVDPWAAQGYQANSGPNEGGCFVPAPGQAGSAGPSPGVGNNSSSGRYPDGADTASNCTDFRTQAATTLPASAASGTDNIKVSSVTGFQPGQTIMIGSGNDGEKAVIATVGTAGAATLRAATEAGATSIPVVTAIGFSEGEKIQIDSGSSSETAVISSLSRFPAPAITVSAPLTHPHAMGAALSGTGITLTAPLTHAHESGAAVTDNLPTPASPNLYAGRP
ncbi:alpha-N-arabinofuranosidase [Acidobacteria bacterium AB60]|nr:alpha-N-arabinofuranosidase [Acidobacteria bacterium AB60]